MKHIIFIVCLLGMLYYTMSEVSEYRHKSYILNVQLFKELANDTCITYITNGGQDYGFIGTKEEMSQFIADNKAVFEQPDIIINHQGSHK